MRTQYWNDTRYGVEFTARDGRRVTKTFSLEPAAWRFARSLDSRRDPLRLLPQPNRTVPKLSALVRGDIDAKLFYGAPLTPADWQAIDAGEDYGAGTPIDWEIAHNARNI